MNAKYCPNSFVRFACLPAKLFFNSMGSDGRSGKQILNSAKGTFSDPRITRVIKNECSIRMIDRVLCAVLHWILWDLSGSVGQNGPG